MKDSTKERKRISNKITPKFCIILSENLGDFTFLFNTMKAKQIKF